MPGCPTTRFPLEDARARLLGLSADAARAQRTLAGLIPSGAVTASLLHDHLRRLLTHPEPETAHRWARETLGAFLDAGTVPCPNFVADLLPVARAAGLDAAAEERFVAGRRLSREWFRDAGPLPADALMRLAGGAGGRPFPPPGRWFDPAADPVAGRGRHAPARPHPCPRPRQAERVRRRGSALEEGHRLRGDRGGHRGRPGRAPAAGRLRPQPRPLRQHRLSGACALDAGAGPIRRVLAERFAEWRDECAAGDLDGLEPALLRLVPMAETMPAAEVLSGLEIADPVDAAWRAPRAGLPEELRSRDVPGRGRRAALGHAHPVRHLAL